MTDFIVNPPDNTCSEPTPNSGASLSSQVTYDGVTLSCLDVQNLGQNLNSVLSSINTVVCSLEASISSNATNISTNTTNITNVNTTISNLDGTDIADGNSYSCITGGATIAATLIELEALVCSIQSSSSLTPELVADVDGIQEFNGAITKPLVIEGSASGKFDTSGIAGFTGTIAGGKVVPQDGKVRDVAGAGVTVNANKDTYFYGKSTGSLAKKEVNNGDPQPSTSNDEVVLWKFVSDGAGITGTTDLRVYEPYDETLFRSTTDVSTFIPNGSIGSSKLDLSAKLQYTAVHALTDPKDITHKSYVDALLSGGTTDFVSRFTASGLANSSIQDDGSTVALGTTPSSFYRMLVDTTESGALGLVNRKSNGDSYGLVITSNTPNTGTNYGLDIFSANSGAGSNIGFRYRDGSEAANSYLSGNGSGEATWATSLFSVFGESGTGAISLANNFTFAGDGGSITTSVAGTTVTISLSAVGGANYTVTNGAVDRAYDANATTLDEIADVLGTLISDLQTANIIG
jgi:hypothetical protein